jgi:hypothetical protein
MGERVGGSAERELGRRMVAELSGSAAAEREVDRVAETYLARLIDDLRPPPTTGTGIGRAQRSWRWLGRWVRRRRQSRALAVDRVRRWTSSPSYGLGRLKVHAKLLLPRLVNWWALLLFLLTAGGATAFVLVSEGERAGDGQLLARAAAESLFTAALLGMVALLWNDLFRCPYVAWRIRRRIAARPARVLPATPGPHQVELLPREDPLEMVPRDELYEEILPGILARVDRDIQVVVGAPGSGKTTALVGLAGLLARVGMVPILLPLLGKGKVKPEQEARRRFDQQFGAHVRSEGELDMLWRWLRKRRRIVVLVDDIDQGARGGERGVLRRMLESFAGEDFPIVVTARPAGIPAGVAASAIDLCQLDEECVVEHVARAAQEDPGSRLQGDAPRRQLEGWVRAGKLAHAPFYLELLASLAAVGRNQELPPVGSLWAGIQRSSCYRPKPDGSYEWDPLWVRFLLLDRFYHEVARGRVRSWLGISARERQCSLRALEGAGLGMLASTGLSACAAAGGGPAPLRTHIEQFIAQDDRDQSDGGEQRGRLSAHEVLDTGERLRILERDRDGHVQFRHRIMLAYFAARRLDGGRGIEAGKEVDEWIGWLLNPHHPEKLTAHMTLTFAALHARDETWRIGDALRDSSANGGRGHVVPAVLVPTARPLDVVERILRSLLEQAARELPRSDETLRQSARPASSASAESWAEIDPTKALRLQAGIDSDDALIKLATAADVFRAVGWDGEPASTGACGGGAVLGAQQIVELVRRAEGATRWTKLGAIRGIATLDAPERWSSIWEFARDNDYAVRRAASTAMKESAYEAYGALEQPIAKLIARAAARSALGLGLDAPRSDVVETPDAALNGRSPKLSRGRLAEWLQWRSGEGSTRAQEVGWAEKDILGLRALGWVLPAIVSGLREERPGPGAAPARATNGELDMSFEQQRRAACARGARQALEQLVALAFTGHNPDLEGSLAEGFKGDAMRHAEDREGRFAGPGWIASNRRLVIESCLDRARFWYARMLLHQALALYAIAGANRDETLEVLARDRGERHPFVRAAVELARRAVERKELGSDRWRGCVWDDENQVAGRRSGPLGDDAAQLVADVTVLLDLKEGSPEECQVQFGSMHELPLCLSLSRDRAEILGSGCPSQCGWGLCPYEQPPPDEPNAHRGVSRAFCRQQQQIAWRHRPGWQRAIGRRALKGFWHEMEHRART